jgi:RimJ/RimL family protein N-acetyltransferase
MVKMKGKTVVLREVGKEDLILISKWMGESDYPHLLGGDITDTEEQLMERLQYEMLQKDTYLHLMVVDQAGQPVGVVSLYINLNNQNAFMGIYIDQTRRNRFYGVDACLTAAYYAFDVLKIHKLNGQVYAYNQRMIRLLDRAHAQREAVLRKHVYRNGQYHNLYTYGFLRSEFDRLLEELHGSFLLRH